ncbi:MAG: O-antigen ligase family protein [Bacilli bacterium]
MINNLKSHIFKLFLVFLCVSPIIDAATSMMIRYDVDFLSLGSYIKIFMLFIFIVYLLFTKSKYKKYNYVYIIISSIYVIITISNNYFIENLSISSCIYETKELIKYFYYPFSLLFLFNVYDEYNKVVEDKYLFLTGCLYSAIIVASTLLRINFDSYGYGNLPGTNGLFYSANEIGAIIGSLFPIIIFYLNKINESTLKKFSMTITVVIYFMSLLAMGTKAAAIAVIITLIAMLFIYLFNIFKNNLNINNLIVVLISSVIIVLSLPFTIFSNYVNFPYADIIKDKNGYSEINKPNPNDDPIIMLSSRDIFLSNTLEVYKKSNFINKLFGIGFIDTKDEKQKIRKLVELDFCDIYFNAGILGFIILLIPSLYFAIMILIKFFKNFNSNIFNIELLVYGVCLCLLLGISLIAGHVLVAPSVSILISIFMSKIYHSFQN